MAYVVRGLEPQFFQPLFGLSDDELAQRGILRMRVSRKPGFPCRVSLKDCDAGESVLLLNHVSHDVENPYRASHAIFVREGASERACYSDAIPPALEARALSLRGFDADAMMVDALLAQPGEADAAIRALFADPRIERIHAHNAVRGCFAAEIERR